MRRRASSSPGKDPVKRNRILSVAVLFACCGGLAAGCLIFPLPPPDGGGGTDGGGGGDGGNNPPPEPPPATTKTVTLSNQSTKGLSLSFRVGAGTLQTINLLSGQTFLVSNVDACACFTLDSFTPPGAPTVEGVSIEACENAQLTFADSLVQSGQITVSVSGGGISSGNVTINVQNTSSRALTVFPFFNGQQQASFSMLQNATQSITIKKCFRLRVLARDATNNAVQAEFVESPATAPVIWTCRDKSATQIEFIKQP